MCIHGYMCIFIKHRTLYEPTRWTESNNTLLGTRSPDGTVEGHTQNIHGSYTYIQKKIFSFHPKHYIYIDIHIYPFKYSVTRWQDIYVHVFKSVSASTILCLNYASAAFSAIRVCWSFEIKCALKKLIFKLKKKNSRRRLFYFSFSSEDDGNFVFFFIFKWRYMKFFFSQVKMIKR